MFRKQTKKIQETINFLKSIHLLSPKYKIGLVSSHERKYSKEQLKNAGIINQFDCIVSGEDDVNNNKPAPDVYLFAAKKLDSNPKECVAFEDTNAGVLAAKRAGMKCVAYRHPKHGQWQDLTKADIIIDNFSKLSIEKVLKL